MQDRSKKLMDRVHGINASVQQLRDAVHERQKNDASIEETEAVREAVRTVYNFGSIPRDWLEAWKSGRMVPPNCNATELRMLIATVRKHTERLLEQALEELNRYMDDFGVLILKADELEAQLKSLIPDVGVSSTPPPQRDPKLR